MEVGSDEDNEGPGSSLSVCPCLLLFVVCCLMFVVFFFFEDAVSRGRVVTVRLGKVSQQWDET